MPNILSSHHTQIRCANQSEYSPPSPLQPLAKKAKVEIEDAALRHEVTASGFPIDIPSATIESKVEGDETLIKQAVSIQIDKDHAAHPSSEEDSSDDGLPLSAKNKSSTSISASSISNSALPHRQKKTTEKRSNISNGKKEADFGSRRTSFDQKPPWPTAPGKGTSILPSASAPILPSHTAPAAAPSTKANGKTEHGTPSNLSASDETDDDESSESGDDIPLSKKTNGATKKSSVAIKKEESDEESEDEPLIAKKNKVAHKSKKERSEKAGKKIAAPKASTSKRVKDELEDDVKPVIHKRKKESPSHSKKAVKREKKEDSVDSGLGTSSGGKKGKGKVKDEDGSQPAESDDEEFKWWEDQNAEGDEGPKWKTLEHNGVLFPPEYTPLPANVKLRFDGMSHSRMLSRLLLI